MVHPVSGSFKFVRVDGAVVVDVHAVELLLHKIAFWAHRFGLQQAIAVAVALYDHLGGALGPALISLCGPIDCGQAAVAVRVSRGKACCARGLHFFQRQCAIIISLQRGKVRATPVSVKLTNRATINVLFMCTFFVCLKRTDSPVWPSMQVIRGAFKILSHII